MPDPPPDFPQRFSAIRDLLACPACNGELSLASDQLVCTECHRSYEVVDGIPVLIPGEKERLG